MFNECKMKLHPNGSMVQTIPKLIPYTSAEAACPRRKSKLGIPPGHRVCRFPDCGENPCQNGWCEENMKNFKCHCSAGYRGKYCNEQSTTKQDTTTMSTMESTTSHPTTTQSTTKQDTTTMSTMESTTSHPTTTPIGVSDENSSKIVADKDTTTTTNAATTTTTTTKSTSTLTDEASSETQQPTTTATSSSTTESPTTPSQDLCFPTPCKNGRICQQLVTSFVCTCPQNFYGPVCECPVFHTPDVGTTREYTFPGFWIAENVTSFDFMVSADNDAHIGLFASNVSDDKYEIAIGGWSNTDGRIVRVDSSGRSLSSPRISVRLSRIPVYNHYQLSFANGHIKLSRYGTQQALMNATDPNPLAVSYVGIWTGYGSQGYWKFPTFCQESPNQDPA